MWIARIHWPIVPSSTPFMLIVTSSPRFGLQQQLSKLYNSTIHLHNNVIHSSVDSARNLGVICDKNCHLHNVSLLFLNHASIICVFEYYWSNYTACAIASSLIHSKIDYCNSLLLNPPAPQMNRLPFVLNSAARAVTKTAKSHGVLRDIKSILKSLQWLKINERIK